MTGGGTLKTVRQVTITERNGSMRGLIIRMVPLVVVVGTLSLWGQDVLMESSTSDYELLKVENTGSNDKVGVSVVTETVGGIGVEITSGWAGILSSVDGGYYGKGGVFNTTAGEHVVGLDVGSTTSSGYGVTKGGNFVAVGGSHSTNHGLYAD